MKPIAGIGTYVPLYEPYWKNFALVEDERLAKELFSGREIKDARGREKTQYLRAGSQRERLAREALVRLLMYYTRNTPNKPNVTVLLCAALRDDFDTKRRVSFGFRKSGGRSDPADDWQVGQYVLSRVNGKRGDVKAAIADAMDKFGLSRKTIFKKVKRTKKR
jgi:hypothetical protein